MADSPSRGIGLRATLCAIATGAIALPLWVVADPPAIPPPPKLVVVPQRVVPKAEVPVVEPMALVDLPPEDARAFNDTIPFSTAPNPAARPFHFKGDAANLARATDCLTAAVLYEAGDDAVGEQAVAQVVLNRLRHPAFPKTLCGVVFEGSERSTGCQFTFTCDGALARKPSETGWKRAAGIAAAALDGSVYKSVGQSTHYHTDWVVPYWQSSLDKVAAVHTHLFFRWTGWWGTPAAFNRTPSSDEPVERQLAAWSDAHKMGLALDQAAGALDDAATLLEPTPPAAMSSDASSFLVTLPHGAVPETFPALAARACGERLYCKYSAWADAGKTPNALPLSASEIATMTFSYLRDRSAAYEKALWNCQQVKRPDKTQCMKVQVYLTAQPVETTLPRPDTSKLPRPTLELEGVRRMGKLLVPKSELIRPDASTPTAQRPAKPAPPPAK
ncbi:cell wall hydrolase [Sphingomonas oligophenolica]|uniref:Cell wall hydrolase n=1 Tax=Sphingomonas oligophenolica TaxID=301154 RepID=A0A502CJK5_9SPHN|nr:cell wall hydrolase [Sphingomonas oligophenolica]TPG12259.1 cell wall hydrolase [Sphingomonas oligophenolica]